MAPQPPLQFQVFFYQNQWLLQDAKARFSELVRRVRSEGPQHVTVHGRDAVVVVAAEEFRRLKGSNSGQTLIDAIQSSRLLVEDGRKAGHTFSQPDLIIAATAQHHVSLSWPQCPFLHEIVDFLPNRVESS